MKLLLDQNISFRLIQIISSVFSSVSSLREHGLHNATDKQIWNFAKSENLIIVSKDSDFHQLSFLHGAPPKVIWVKRANCSTLAIAQLLIDKAAEIKKFAEDAQAAFLILD